MNKMTAVIIVCRYKYREFHGLEWHSDCEMEGKVAFELGMYNWVMSVTICIGGMYCFHAAIESEDEIVKVKTKTKTIGNSYLPPEFIELKLASRLIFIVSDCPYITCINEGCAIEFPEKMCSVFNIQVKFDVTRLVNEVDTTV